MPSDYDYRFGVCCVTMVWMWHDRECSTPLATTARRLDSPHGMPRSHPLPIPVLAVTLDGPLPLAVHIPTCPPWHEGRRGPADGHNVSMAAIADHKFARLVKPY